MVSAVDTNDSSHEGPPSDPITVRVETNDEVGRTQPPGDRTAATPLTGRLYDSTYVAVLPDGRVLVAERAGRVRLFQHDALASAPALVLSEVATGRGRGLLALAVDRDFDRTRAVFVAYSTADGLRVARFEVAGPALVSQAILLAGLPTPDDHPSAVLRTGPDGMLYLALDDRRSPERSSDLGDPSGKVLRIELDGTTPDDQPSASANLCQ